MTNNTTANATTNATSNETNLLEGLLDQLTAAPELLAVVAVVAGAGAYAYFRIPRFSFLVNKYVPFLLKRYESEIDGLIENNLTKLQKIAYDRLDSTLQQQMRDSVLKDVIMSNYDHYDDEFAKTVKTEIRGALASVRGESK
ncbi:MAG: hypothetical protein QF535_00365 [Anaerolineales bacterium]|jgi:hypothetical protein|nr:hypothetical protein [Anaerolineales bacterium]|tara:strand:+ start:115 stop:540 length:426 start_codon:yes stop_codon:yes gene_type:complete